jgi:RNA polymerase sigma-70 factor (ECF subfamily)
MRHAWSLHPMSSPADRPIPAAVRDPAVAARVEQLFERHGALVRSICRSLLREGGEAEDAVQQTFLSAQRALANGSSPRDAAAWLATIARHESLARVRARMREPLPVELEDRAAVSDTHSAAVRRQEAGELRDALAELPAQQREAILLREVRGLSYQEVAVSLSVTTSAVESLLFRARRTLQTRLQEALAAFSPGAWVQPLRELVARLVGSGLVAPAAAKVAALGVGTAVVTGGALVGPTVLGLDRVPHVSRPARPSAQHARHPVTAKAPAASSAKSARQLVRVDSGSWLEGTDRQTSSGRGEREHTNDTTNASDGIAASGSGRTTTDDARTQRTTSSSSDDSRTGTTDDRPTQTSPGATTTNPGTPDD